MPHPAAFDKDIAVPLICEALKRGATIAAAAQYAGIHRDTLHEWQANHAYISDAIAYAQAECRVAIESKFADDATNGNDWRARSDWLKRRYRDDWGDKLDLTGLPDHILLELLGGKTGTLQATQYPSAPIALLTGKTATVESSDCPDVQTPVGTDESPAYNVTREAEGL